ncbi:DUF7573 domain-containing protein [Halorubrum halophilum]|uniref:DUF7573 domain-containing protein n=1 Tax=Halorubrum halophilum TaxID=413816 RepID=UPI0006784620|nr:hypothetical protein [Halorubrum halophilum]
MPEDRSLDEFEGSDDDASESDPADADPTDTLDDPIPATSTATWTTGGADCERCGERVERRWLDDGDRVCPACKSW